VGIFQKKLYLLYPHYSEKQILVQITHHKIVGQGNSGTSFLLEKTESEISVTGNWTCGHNSALLTGFSYLARAISRENLMAQKSKMTDNCLKLSKYVSADVFSFYLGKQLCLLPPTLGNTVVFSQKKKLHKCFFFSFFYSHVLISFLFTYLYTYLYVFQVIFAHCFIA
jgi:hypothetical protein